MELNMAGLMYLYLKVGKQLAQSNKKNNNIC